jgi:glycosyltransferase involved in cell wall biosynthesis
MRIVHLSTSDSGGGAFRAAYRLHTGLRRLGHESHMLVARKALADDTISAVVPAGYFFSRTRRRRRARRIHRDYERYRATIPPDVEPFSDDRTLFAGEIINHLPPCDVINLHWIGGFLDHESFFARYPKQVPLVWRLADMGALTGGCHYDQGCGKFTRQCGACPQLGSRQDNDLSRQIWLRKRQALDRIGPGGISIVATSNWIACEARSSALLGRFPITVIPNGLDTDDFAPRDKRFSRALWNIPQDARVILFAAESITNRRKGFAHLAGALASMSGAAKPFLVSVGGGNAPIDADFPHLGLGRISSDKLLSLAYSAADIFVIPSLQESFGQTVIESLACGTPVVGFASGGIPDMVRPGQTGWLAPTGDTAALRDAIVAALVDPNRPAMSDRCRRIVEQEYSLDVSARAYERLYQTLIDRAAATDSQGSAVHRPVPSG